MIVTGTCAELEDPNSEVELTLSHTWNDINTALSNNKDVEIHVDVGNTGVSVITVLLSLVLLVCAIYDFCGGRYIWGSIFATVFVALLVSSIIKIMNEQDIMIEKNDNTDAIFKDHEE